MDKATVEKLGKILKEYGTKYYCVYDWELTDEEENLFKNSEIGDEIHIDTPMVPVVLDESEGYFIGMYSSKEEIPNEFMREKTVQLERIESIVISCKASATVLKTDVNLVLNPYSESDCECSFSMKEIDDFYYEITSRMEK